MEWREGGGGEGVVGGGQGEKTTTKLSFYVVAFVVVVIVSILIFRGKRKIDRGNRRFLSGSTKARLAFKNERSRQGNGATFD